MRVGIDYRVAAAHAPGIGRYVRELTRALSALEEPDLGLALVDVGREPDSVPESMLGLRRESRGATRLRLAVPRRAAAAAGAFGLSVERFVGDLAVFHHAKPPLLPVERAVQTLAIGDLPLDPARRAELARAASRCAAVFVFSESARRAVADALGLDADRVVAVPVGADHWARELDDPGSIPLADPPRVLVLGAQTGRREPLRWLRVLESLAADGLGFEVFCGGRREAGDPDFFAAVAASPIAERIRFGAPAEDALPRLVAESSVMIHLDRDALTPVTPLEAFAAGCAVITSPSQVFTEALGEHAVAAHDDDSLRAAIASAIERRGDASARAARRAAGARFTWRACARATVAHWRALVDRS